MTSLQILEQNSDEVIRLFRNGVSMFNIAYKFGFKSQYPVKRFLLENGLKMRNKNQVHKHLYNNKHNIITSFKNGKSAKSIAAQYKCPLMTVLRLLNSNGIKTGYRKSKIWDKYDQIIKDFQSGRSINWIQHKYKCGYETVKAMLRKAGIEIKSRSNTFSKQIMPETTVFYVSF